MEAKARAQLLRERFRAIGGKPIVVEHKPRTQKPTTYRTYFSFGCSVFECRPGWVARADAVARGTVKTKRTTRKTALQRIAERWDERKTLAAPMLRR